MLSKIKEVAKGIIELGLYVVALGIILQVIFGATVPFFGDLNIVGTITDIIKTLGDSGLVGLLAVGTIVYLFNTNKK